MIAETSVPKPIVQRWRWLAVFLSGLLLWILSLVVTGLTQNPNLIPTVVLLGSFLVPATEVGWFESTAAHKVNALRTSQHVALVDTS